MKTTNIFLALIVIATLVLAGCGENQETTTKRSYVGGTNGLTMEFQQGQPPEEVYDGDSMDFSVGIMLKNMGEQAIFDDTYEQDEDFESFGRLTLRGITPNSYNLEQDDIIIDFEEYGISLMPYKMIEGKIIEGGIASPIFGPLRYQHQTQGINDLNLGMDLCYNYRTKSTTTICIAPNEAGKKFKICNPYEDKITSNSGGLVHITKITENPGAKNKITLTIELEKVNKEGIVFKPIDPNAITNDDKVCNEISTNRDINKVYMRIYLPEGENVITCSEFGNENEGIVTIHDNQPKVVVCSLEIEEGTPDYETQLFIDLTYAFGQYIEKTIKLKSYE